MTHLKTAIKTFILILYSIGMLSAQDEPTGMPGDNFSLYGALELFKKSESPEHYEELLNKEDNKVNNLDLNGDGETDYIRVVDLMEEDAHAITLQVPISKKESQDIAVIVIEKTGSENAILQIIGDEEIYGEELVVEPYDEQVSGSGRGGPNPDYEITRVIVNVWFWPSVRSIYRPTYRVYVSPWYWGNYPRWWRPWRPLSWAVYSPRVVTWRAGFRVTPTLRVTRARKIYTPRRTTSVTVVNRYKVNKTTYVSKKKTTVVTKGNRTSSNKKAVVKKANTKAIAKDENRKTGAKDGNKKVAKNKKSTKVKASNGNKSVKAKKTTTKKVKKKKKN